MRMMDIRPSQLEAYIRVLIYTLQQAGTNKWM